MTKKKFLAVALVAILAIMAAVGSSLAYLKDTDKVTNTFTIGNVKIDLIESIYHREGNDNSGDKSIPDPTNTASGMKYVTNGHKAFTNEEIKTNAKEYEAYLTARGNGMVPGRNAAKCPYVVNTGANDAYIRIRVLVPSAANNDFVAVTDGGVIKSQWCTTSMLSGEFVAAGDYPGDMYSPYIEANVEVGDVKYDQYTFVRNEPLKAGEMTEWNVWNFIGLDKNATAADIQKAVEAGAISVATDGGMTFNVLVQADAIQAEGFANATAAFAEFDK